MLKLDNAGFYYGQKNWVFRRHSFESNRVKLWRFSGRTAG